MLASLPHSEASNLLAAKLKQHEAGIKSIRDIEPVLGIDFTLHIQDDAMVVSMQERVVKEVQAPAFMKSTDAELFWSSWSFKAIILTNVLLLSPFFLEPIHNKIDTPISFVSPPIKTISEVAFLKNHFYCCRTWSPLIPLTGFSLIIWSSLKLAAILLKLATSV